ncbi:MAG: hypothetical protein K2Q01_11810 [Rickettsiales bacterium]|nr:hypothetical protein [Rickettsiales bacterium]
MAYAPVRAAFFAFLCLAAAGCTPTLPSSSLRPENPKFYKELPTGFALRKKVTIGEISSALSDSAATPESFRPAMEWVLGDADILAKRPEDAPYVLEAKLLNYRWLETGLTKVKVGVTVHYRVLKKSTSKVVYDRDVVSSYSVRKGLLDDTEKVMLDALGTAFGENLAQLARELAVLKPAGSDPLDKPLRRLKGAL